MKDTDELKKAQKLFKSGIPLIYTIQYGILALPLIFYAFIYIKMISANIVTFLLLTALGIAAVLLTAIFIQMVIMKDINLVLSGTTLDESRLRKAKSKAINFPLYFVILTFIGWTVIINAVAFVPVYLISSRNMYDLLIVNILAFSGGLIAMLVALFISENAVSGFLALPEVNRLEINDRVFKLYLTTRILTVCVFMIVSLSLMLSASIMISKMNELSSREEITNTLVAIIFGIASTILVSVLFARSLSRPIVKATNTLKDISEGEGDLTKQLVIASKDEIGDMSKYFNKTFGNIKNLVGIIKHKIHALTNTGHELTVNMKKTTTAVDNIASNFEDIKSLEAKQQKETDAVNKALENIKTSIKLQDKLIDEQTDSVNTSSSAIEEMTANIHSVTKTLIENSKNVEALTEASEHGRTALQTVAQEIQGIAKDSEGLLEINTVMNNIAAQTNLLSMNAAIEAAHAGDSGKGFAVVADEIRKLAESSSKQSKTTASMLKKIKASIDNITKSSNEVLSRFEAIDTEVKTVSEHEMNIRHAMEEQEVGGKQILDAIGRLKEITGSVQKGSENMSKSGDDLTRETGEFIKISNEAISGMTDIVNGALREIKTAVTHVTEMSIENNRNFDELKSETNKFKISTGNEKQIVLVVDDDEIHLEMTKSFLDQDYDVITVKSCEEALKLLYQGLAPHLIFLDLVMPETDGWQTFERIRGISNLHSVPIAIFTVSNDPADIKRAKTMGAVDYIKKPTSRDELLGRIEKILGKSSK